MGEPIADWWRPEGGQAIGFIAEDVTRERTGIHGKLYIRTNQGVLAWSRFNTDKDEERVRLVNAATKNLSKIDREGIEPVQLKHAFDRFCDALWERVIGQIDIGPMAGASELARPQLILDPFLVHGGSTIAFALPGTGKSYTALAVAVSIDAGCAACFNVMEQRPVLYVNLERSAVSMAQRLARVNEALGLDRARELAFLNARGQRLSDVIAGIAAYGERTDGAVVILDSISRAGMGDLERNAPANAISDALNGACETWFGIAHTPRQDPTHVFGSIHFDAAADVIVQVISDQKDTELGIGLKVTKANDLPKMKVPYTIALRFDDDGLIGIRRAHADEFQQVDAAGRTWLDDARDFLAQYGKATAEEIAEEVGKHRTEISRVLGKLPDVRREKTSRTVYFSLVSDRVG